MADGNLGNLLVSIGTDTKDLSKGLGQAQKDIQSFASGANKLLGLIGFAVSAGALINITKKTIEYGQELDKMSKQTGLAASEIAKLKYVADQSETSISSVAGTFRFLSRAINEAHNGNEEAIKTFKKFGIEFNNVDGTAREVSSAMLDVADRMKNTENQTVLLAESQKLLGKNVSDVIPFFKEGSDGIRRMTKEYEEMQKRIGLTDGQINEFVKKSDELDDKWKDLQTSFRFLAISILPTVVKAMQDVIQTLINATVNVKKLMDSMADLIPVQNQLGKDALSNDPAGIFARNMALLQGEDIAKISKNRADILASGVKDGQPIVTNTSVNQNSVFGQVGNQNDSKGILSNNFGAPGSFDATTVSKAQQRGQIAPAGFYQGGGNEVAGIKFGDITAKMEELKTKWQDVSKQMGELWGTTMEGITAGFGTSVAEMIVDGADFGESMKKLWQDIAKSVIAEIVKIIAQQIILFTWQLLTGTPGSGNLMPGSGGGGGGKKFLGLFDKGGVTPQAREGLLYGANGFARTGNYGESGMHAIVHPNEIISPIDKFFDAIQSMAPTQNVFNVTGQAANDPQLLAELVAIETDRRRRRP